MLTPEIFEAAGELDDLLVFELGLLQPEGGFEVEQALVGAEVLGRDRLQLLPSLRAMLQLRFDDLPAVVPDTEAVFMLGG